MLSWSEYTELRRAMLDQIQSFRCGPGDVAAALVIGATGCAAVAMHASLVNTTAMTGCNA